MYNRVLILSQPVLPASPPLPKPVLIPVSLRWRNTRWSSVHSLPSPKLWDHLGCLHLSWLSHLKQSPSSVRSDSPLHAPCRNLHESFIMFCELALLALHCFSFSLSFVLPASGTLVVVCIKHINICQRLLLSPTRALHRLLAGAVGQNVAVPHIGLPRRVVLCRCSKKASISVHVPKVLLALCFLMSHSPKQVTGTSPESL